jgi:N-acyl-L-homoserine lactone synthetase
MIHLITAANRSAYARQIDEMHRLRWKFYVEDRGWARLREIQEHEGIERDDYDDDRAVYVMGIDDDGCVTGSMRLRPTDDKSLLADHFPHLIDDAASFTPAPDTWEITRIVRKPENRSKDHALRFAMNTAMLEMAICRGVRKLVATSDSFLVPQTRSVWRHKFRPLGLPAPYAEGEAIALDFDADEESLQMTRERAGIVTPQMFELGPPIPDRPVDVVLAERVARLASYAQPEQLADIAAWFESRGVGAKIEQGADS